MPKTKDKALQFVKDTIVETLHRNSGGIKEIELMTNLYNVSKEFGRGSMELIDTAIEILQMEKKIVVLAYTWHMGEGIDREKRFIYTP